MKLSLKAELSKTLSELKKYPDVAAVFLFGSYAKGKAKPLSDIDIAAMIKNPSRKIEAEVASLSSRFFDVVNFHRLPLYIQFEVFKYGRPLFVRSKKHLAEAKLAVLREYLDMAHLYGQMSREVLK